MELFGTCSTPRNAPYIHPSHDSILEFLRTLPNGCNIEIAVARARVD